MTSGPMRQLLVPSSSLPRWQALARVTRRWLIGKPPNGPLNPIHPSRYLAQVRPEPISELWFTSSSPARGPAEELLEQSQTIRNGNDDHKPPDERTLKLGKTLRTLSPLLPTILTSPLPLEILSPSISLHLFPSTHPHLPVVKGRVPYRAALWTAPVAWGCVPIVGNVRLSVVSERIVRNGFVAVPSDHENPDLGEEKLVVRWKTEANSMNNESEPSTTTSPSSSSSVTSGEAPNGGINRGLSALLGGSQPLFSLSPTDQFTGIFVFTFDSAGRIASHTIEHADENNGIEKTSKMVTLTDWLLGRAKWGKGKTTEEELIPGLAMRVCRAEWAAGRSRLDRDCGRGHN